MKALVGQEDAPKALRLNDRSVLNRTSLDVAWMMSGAARRGLVVYDASQGRTSWVLKELLWVSTKS